MNHCAYSNPCCIPVYPVIRTHTRDKGPVRAFPSASPTFFFLRVAASRYSESYYFDLIIVTQAYSYSSTLLYRKQTGWNWPPSCYWPFFHLRSTSDSTRMWHD
jgi:hypothetical protein